MSLFAKLLGRSRSPQSHSPSSLSLTSSPATPPSPPTAQKPKSLAELEQELQASSTPITPKLRSPQPQRQSSWTGKLLGLACLVGLPAGILWAVNLPYPPVRRPVVDHAPILLLPSYISFDHHYREAIDQVAQAEQLVDAATSPADLERGAQSVAQAKEHLDALPLWLWDEWPRYSRYWWSSRWLSYAGFNQARSDIGRLDAKLFQERNAQTALVDAEQVLTEAKQRYQQANSPSAQLVAISAWQTAIEGFDQVPFQTVAGQRAQQQLVTYNRELQETAGLAASNQTVSTYIQVAREYGARAAQAGQNPPHDVEEWERVEGLWQAAIAQLNLVPREDLIGYATAQELMARYKDDLSQIQVRRQQEAQSVQSLQAAQDSISRLLASNEYASRDDLISQIYRIITQLEQVDTGTTAYAEAQVLLLQARNKLDQAEAEFDG